MIFSAPVIISVLSLLSSACALAVNARQSDCSLACPETDATGNALSTSSIDDTSVSCLYTGELAISCIYDAVGLDSFLSLQLGSRFGLDHRYRHR